MIVNLNPQNLLTADVQAIIHQANCFHTMGSGIAAQIRKIYPEAYAADCKTKKGSREKLGTFSRAATHDGKMIYNVYGQFGFGQADRKSVLGRNTEYDALFDGLKRVVFDCRELGITKFGVPAKIGCDLGGGSWLVVEAMLKQIFEIDILQVYKGDDVEPTLYICHFDPSKNK